MANTTNAATNSLDMGDAGRADANTADPNVAIPSPASIGNFLYPTTLEFVELELAPAPAATISTASTDPSKADTKSEIASWRCCFCAWLMDIPEDQRGSTALDIVEGKCLNPKCEHYRCTECYDLDKDDKVISRRGGTILDPAEYSTWLRYMITACPHEWGS